MAGIVDVVEEVKDNVDLGKSTFVR